MNKTLAKAVGDLHVAMTQAYGTDWCSEDEAASTALAAELGASLKGRPVSVLRTAIKALGDDLLRPASPPALPALGRWLDNLVAEYHAPDEARELNRALRATYGARWLDQGGLPALFKAFADAGIDVSPQSCRTAHEMWLRSRETRFRYAPPMPSEMATLSLRECASDHAIFRHFVCGDPRPKGLGDREESAGRSAARELGPDRTVQLRASEAESLFMSLFWHFLARPEGEAKDAHSPALGGNEPLPPSGVVPPSELSSFLLKLADEVESRT